MRTRSTRYLAAASLAALAVALPQIARADPIALPSGSNLRWGAASVGGNGTDTVSVSQVSDRAVIEWNSFSVGAGGKVTFAQPSGTSATLNRVTGATPSSIAGRIESNGRVFLINPNGIEITSSGVIDTHGGFVASTLYESDEQFAAYQDYFVSGSGRAQGAAVSNAGQIITSSAGIVALLGGSVSNSGTIIVPQGKIAMGVGSEMTLDINGNGFLQILNSISVNDAYPGNLATNSGTLSAAGGRIEVRTRVQAGGSFDLVNITGDIRADSVSGQGGTVILDAGGSSVGDLTVAASATVSASSSGGAGGQISVNAVDRMTLNGSLLATGTTSGGAITTGAFLNWTRISGTLDASGEIGGRIDVAGGAPIDLYGSARLTARGGSGMGGLVRVGGAFLGGAAEAAEDPDYAMQVTRFGTLATLPMAPWQSASPTASHVTTDAGSLIDVSSTGGAGGSATVSSADYTQWNGGVSARGATPGSISIHSNGDIYAYNGGPADSQLAFSNVDPGIGGTVLLSAQSFTFANSWTGYSGLYNGALDHMLYGYGANVRLRATDGISMDDDQSLVQPDGSAFAIAPHIGNLTLQAAGSIHVSGTIDLIHQLDRSDPAIAARYASGELRDGAITLIANDDRVTPAGSARQGLNGITADGASAGTRFNGSAVTLSIGAGVGAAAADDPARPSIGAIDLLGNIGGEGAAARPDAVTLSIYDYGTSTVALDPGAVGVQAALTPGKIILRGNTIDAATVNVSGSLLLAPIDGINQTSTIKAGSFTWTDEATATIRGIADVATNSLPATLRIEGASGLLGLATVLDYGHSGSDLVALGNENANYALGGALTRRYGDPALDLGDPLAVLRGSPTGATNTVLTPGSLTVAGSDDASYNVGVRRIAVSLAGSSTAFATGRYGYVDLAPGTLSLSIVPVGLTVLAYNVASPSYVYGSPLTAVKLTGIIGNDDVAPTVQLSGAANSSTLVAKGSGAFAFAANTPVQSRTFDLLGLTGNSAGNYFIDLTSAPTSGTLTISPRLLTASAAAASFTYGSPTASVTLGNIVAGDMLAPTATVNGSTVTLGAIAGGGFGFEATRGVVNTTYALAGLTGAAAGNYILPTNYTALGGTLVITPKALGYAAGSFTRTYGDAVVPPALALTGIINNDAVSVGSVGVSGNGYTGPLGERTAAASYSLYAATLTGAQAANYSAPLTGGPTLTISPRPLTATAANASYVYGSTAAPITLDGLLENDAVGLAASLAGTAVPLTTATTSTTGHVAGSASNTAILERTYSFGTHGVTDASYSLTGLTGAASGNYVLAPDSLGSSGHLTITPKPLGYAAGSFNRTYGDTVVTPTLGLTGIINGDSVAVSGVSVTGATGTVVLAQKTPAGTYMLGATSLSGAGAANYSLPTGTGPTLTIARRPLTFSLLDTTLTYGSGNVPLNWIGNTPLAGDDVRPDASVDKGTGTSLANFQFSANAGRFGQYTDVGTYRLYASALTGADAANYSYTGGLQQALVQITPKSVTPVADSASRTYGSVTLPTTSLVGVLPGDSQVQAVVSVIGVNGATWNGVDSDAGTYRAGAFALTGSRAENYALLGNGTYTFSILPKTVSAVLSSSSLTYGDAPAAGLLQLGGVLARDAGSVSATIGLVDAHGAATTLDTTTDVGTYSAVINALSGARAGNYVIGSASGGTLTITPRALSYTLLGTTGTYGSATRFGGTVLAGFANGDSAQAVASLIDASGATIASVTGATFATTSEGQAAGSYTLRVTGLTGGNASFKASNYTLGGTDATLTIAPRLVSYTMGIVQRAYGAGDASGLGGAAVPVTTTLNGLLASDAGSVTAQTAALSEGRFPVDANDPRLNAGTYVTTVTGLTGTGAGNYKLTDNGSTQGTLIVNPLSVSASFADASARYGDGIKPAATGFTPLPGDSVVVIGALQSATGTETFAADGRTSIAARTAPGAWALTPIGLDGSQSGNYRLTTARPATLTITPRPLDLQLLNVTATYGDTIATRFDVPLIGVLNGDDVAGVGLVSGQPVNAGTYAINGLLTGRDAGKYSIVTTPATLTINPLSIYATGPNAGSARSTYGDPLSVLFAGTADSKPVAPAYSIALFDNGTPVTAQRPNAGGYQANVVVSDTNYSLANPRILYVVDPRPVSAVSTSAIYGDQPVLTLMNVMPGDAVTARVASLQAGSGASFAPWNADGSLTQLAMTFGNLPDAGQSYTVTGATLGGAAAANYVFSGGSVTITPRPITITSFGAAAQASWGDTSAVYSGLRTSTTGQPYTLYDSSGIRYANLVRAADAGGIAPLMSTTVQESGNSVAVSNADVGSYRWTSTGIAKLSAGLPAVCGGGPCASSNYVLAASGNATADLTITPRVVHYTSTGGTAVYGDAISVGVTLLDLPSDKLATIAPVIGFDDGQTVSSGGGGRSVGPGLYATTLLKAPADSYKVVIASTTGTNPANISWQAADADKGTLTIAKREVTYTTFDGYSLYPIGPVPGSLDKLLSPQLSGVVAGDAVSAVLNVGASPFTDFGPTFPVGAYPVSVAYLSGPDGDNYTVAATGNKQGTLTVAALRDTELDGALSLIGNNVTSNIISGLQKAASDQAAAAAKAASSAAGPAGPSSSSAPNASEVVYTPPVSASAVGDSSTSTNDAARLPSQTSSDGSTFTATASAGGASAKTVVTTTADLGPIDSGADMSAKFAASPIGLSGQDDASATLSYQVSVPVGYGTLSNTTTLGAYASSQASIGVMGVKVADQAGVSLKNMVVWSGGCGSATCGASTYQEVGLIASAEVKFGKDGFGETFSAGAGARVGAGGSIGGSAGSVSTSAGVSTGRFAAGLAFDTQFSGSQIKLGISTTIGVGVVGVDLNLSVSLTPFGSIEAYTVAVDPAATAARLAIQEKLTNEAIELRFQQQQFIADLFDGKIGSVAGMDARRDQLAAASQAFQQEATSQGFGISTNGGTVSINDNNAPATMTLYRYSGGWGNTVVDAVTSDWGSTIYTPVSGGLVTAVDGAKGAANKVADTFSNAANKIADLF